MGLILLIASVILIVIIGVMIGYYFGKPQKKESKHEPTNWKTLEDHQQDMRKRKFEALLNDVLESDNLKDGIGRATHLINWLKSMGQQIYGLYIPENPHYFERGNAWFYHPFSDAEETSEALRIAVHLSKMYDLKDSINQYREDINRIISDYPIKHDKSAKLELINALKIFDLRLKTINKDIDELDKYIEMNELTELTDFVIKCAEDIDSYKETFKNLTAKYNQYDGYVYTQTPKSNHHYVTVKNT